MAGKRVASERLITDACIISFPHLAEPQAAEEGGEEKYSAAFIFTKEQQDGAEPMRGSKSFADLEEAAMAVATEYFGKTEKEIEQLVAKGKIALPWRDGNDKEGYPEDSVYFNARSKRQPGLVLPIADKDGRPKKVDDDDITDVFYPGAIVRASVVFFGYDNKQKGVGVALNNVQKLRDGERLDFSVDAADEFETDEDAVGSLEGMGADEDEQPQERKPRAGIKTSKPAARRAAPPTDEEEEDGEDISALVGAGRGRAASRRGR